MGLKNKKAAEGDSTANYDWEYEITSEWPSYHS